MISPVAGEDIRRLMRARLSVAVGNLTTIHASLVEALGVSESVQLRLDFLHVVVYEDRVMDPNGPYHELIAYTSSGEVSWFDPVLIDVVAEFYMVDDLGAALNSYFNSLDKAL